MTRPQRILSLTLTLSLFVILAPLVILYALGYRVYQDPLHIERTGLILVRTAVSRINAYIDSQAAEKSSPPIRFAFLRPGPHRIILTREDLLPWSATVNVRPGEAVRVIPASLYSTPRPMDIPEGLVYDCRSGDAFVFHHSRQSTPSIDVEKDLPETIIIKNRQTYTIPHEMTCLSSTVIGSIKIEKENLANTDDASPQMALRVFDFPPLFGDGTVRTTRLPQTSSLKKIDKLTSGEVIYQREDSSTWVWASTSEPKKIFPIGLMSWSAAGRSIVQWDLDSITFFSSDGALQQKTSWASLFQTIPLSIGDIQSIANDDGLILYGPWGHVVIRDGQISDADAQKVDATGYRHGALQPVVTWVVRDRILHIQIGETTSTLQLDEDTSVIDVDPDRLVVILRKLNEISFRSLVPSISGIQTSSWSIAPSNILDAVSLEHGISVLIQPASDADAKRTPQWMTVIEDSSL